MQTALLYLLYICVFATYLQPVLFALAQEEAGEEVQAIDSDYLTLYTSKSTIPIDHVGNGVFASVDIPAGEILCEYRGPIIEANMSSKFQSSKKFQMKSITGESLIILGDNICSLINDPVMIVGQKYTRAQMDAIKSSPDDDCIPTYPGLNYNAFHKVTLTGKIFIVSSQLIPKGTEVFFSYGRYVQVTLSAAAVGCATWFMLRRPAARGLVPSSAVRRSYTVPSNKTVLILYH